MKNELKITVRFPDCSRSNQFKNCSKFRFKTWAKAWEHVRYGAEYYDYVYSEQKNVIVNCLDHYIDKTVTKKNGHWYIDVYSDLAKEVKLDNTIKCLHDDTVKSFSEIPKSRSKYGI